jgi:hypothetical protein
VYFQDSSTRKNDGTLTNMDPATDWQFAPELGRWALDFDNSNDHVIIANAPQLNPARLTVGCWYMVTVSSADQWPLVLKSFTSHVAPYYQYGLAVYQSASNRVLAGWLTVGGVRYTVSATGQFTLNTWHHAALTYDGETARLYSDGVEVDSDATMSGDLSSYATDLWLGAYENVALNSGTVFGGRLSDPCIWSEAASQAEITALADPSNVDLSGLLMGRRRPAVRSAVANRRRRLLIAGAAA